MNLNTIQTTLKEADSFKVTLLCLSVIITKAPQHPDTDRLPLISKALSEMETIINQDFALNDDLEVSIKELDMVLNSKPFYEKLLNEITL